MHGRFISVSVHVTGMGEGDTLLNAAIGGVVGIGTSIILGPASPIAGGGVAGYLQRGDTTDGATVGAISGLIALIPFLLFFVLFAVVGVTPVIGFMGMFPPDPVMDAPKEFAIFSGGVFGFFFLFVAIVGVLLAVGAGALGGILGVYVATETDLGG